MSGQTKNPVRYNINRDSEIFSSKVSKLKEGKVENYEINLSDVAEHAKSLEKCTVTIEVGPSKEFEKVMDEFDLTELELIDTQGLLDSLEEEAGVPPEIKECAVLLYLYNARDQGSRGDYINKYRSFLNAISDKPLIFLETDTQWQVSKEDIESCLDDAKERLNDLDNGYYISADEIRERYSILTGNDEYNNNATFILTSILSELESSVNFHEVKLRIEEKEKFFDECVRICSAHTMQGVFKRLAGIKQSLQSEFDKAKGQFEYPTAFSTSYGLLNDIFIKQFQRIDYNSSAEVLRYARRDWMRFEKALLALQNGKLFNTDLTKTKYEIYTSYGYYSLYETYENQDVLDCMQLLLDLYKGYLARISVAGNKLSKAVQVFLSQSVSNDYMCRDTGYDIPILNEKTFLYCMEELKRWIGDIPVDRVVYKDYDKFDEDRFNKKSIIETCNKYVGDTEPLITKLVYLCMCINNKMYNMASDAILNRTREFIGK
ncbi:hypothetical protein D1872_210820 [compost metagenome]